MTRKDYWREYHANKKIRWSCAACEKARREHNGTVG